MLPSPRLQKLHVGSLVIRHWMLFLKTRPFVKQNNAEFTNVSSFTSVLTCSTHFTLSCRTLPFSLPTNNNFFQICVYWNPQSLPGRSCLGPLGVSFSGNWRSSELDSLHFWTSDIQDLPTSCRKFLYVTFLFVFSVLYTKKNVLKRAQFSRYSTTFFNHFTVFLRT